MTICTCKGHATCACKLQLARVKCWANTVDGKRARRNQPRKRSTLLLQFGSYSVIVLDFYFIPSIRFAFLVMVPYTREDLKEKRKAALQYLPIWDVAQQVGVEIDRLEFDIKRHQEFLERVEETLNNLPKIPNDGNKTTLPPKQHLDQDIVKVYRRSKAGEIIIEEPKTSSASSHKNHNDLKKSNNNVIEKLRAQPRAGDLVFAQVNETGPWIKCKIKSLIHKTSTANRHVTLFRLVTCDDERSVSVGKYGVARYENYGNKLMTSKRVVAGYSEDTMEPGIIGQDAVEEFDFKYMIFLDNGECRYFKTNQVYPTFYQSAHPWPDVRHTGPVGRFYLGELNSYFKTYPKRLLMQVRVGDQIDILNEDAIKVPAVITKIDHDVMTLIYKDRTQKSIHRGCPRLTKTSAQITELLQNDVNTDILYPKLVGNMNNYHQAGCAALGVEFLRFLERFDRSITICGNTARKSTGPRPQPRKVKVKLNENFVAEDREQLPNIEHLLANAPKHICTPNCLLKPEIRTEASVPDIIEEFRDMCDLKVPLQLGWRRIMVVDSSKGSKQKKIVYESPCGRIFKDLMSIRFCLQRTCSKFDVDYFTFETAVYFNRPNAKGDVYYFLPNIAVDKDGRCLENKFISVMNPHNEERLPLDFEYRSDTFPHPMLAAKGFSFNYEFKSGCDCENDCSSRAGCACHRLTEQAFGTSNYNRGSINLKCHYKNKRLLGQVSTGIFECNSFCKCSSKCPNRVVQNGIRLRMQIRKTLSKGWGVHVLDDVPKGSFICTYSAELLDDADQYGDCDMYFADLDYITLLEEVKQDMDKQEDRCDEGVASDVENSDDEDATAGKNDLRSKKRPVAHESSGSSDESSRLSQYEYAPRGRDRYPKRSRPVATKGSKREVNQQFRRLHALLGEVSDYTLDARMQGNIGRFFNHSCDPNSMVQNVFIETHDLRFPVVAFFTKRDLKADDEITWDYNYKIDSIAGRKIICNCGAANCKGRIL